MWLPAYSDRFVFSHSGRSKPSPPSIENCNLATGSAPLKVQFVFFYERIYIHRGNLPAHNTSQISADDRHICMICISTKQQCLERMSFILCEQTTNFGSSRDIWTCTIITRIPIESICKHWTIAGYKYYIVPIYRSLNIIIIEAGDYNNAIFSRYNIFRFMLGFMPYTIHLYNHIYIISISRGRHWRDKNRFSIIFQFIIR